MYHFMFGCVKMKFDEFIYMTKSMYENTLTPIALTDEKLNVCWVNNEASKRFPSLALPGGLSEIISDYDFGQISEILAKGKSFIARKLSEPINEMSVNIIPVLDNGSLIGCQVFFRYDGADNGSVRDERPEEIIAAFSNEYKMPLTVIFSTLGLMARHLDDNEDEISKAYLKLITQNCYRLLRLSNNLVEVSRYRSGIAKINPKTGDLCKFIYGQCEAAMILTRSIGIPLDCIVPKERIITTFDPQKISLAFLNLISNSCKYTREGNRITVKLEKHGGKAVVTVSDRGGGIKSEILDNIFEPYFSYKTESAISGAGLGLSIVKFVITQHGGTIAIQSHEGEGTKVAFSLPIRHDENLPDYTAKSSADYLADRFSLLYVQMSDVCGCPLP
jgi:signal transduction histidine kinase